jgi:hypothetical protein
MNNSLTKGSAATVGAQLGAGPPVFGGPSWPGTRSSPPAFRSTFAERALKAEFLEVAYETIDAD